MEEFQEDLERLLIILKKFSLNPLMGGKGNFGDPVARLIFCHIISSKYDMVLPKGNSNEHVKRDVEYKKELRDFLGVTNAETIRYYFRDGALKSLIGYDSYELKYKVCKLAFYKDPIYLELERLEKIRDDAQNKMNELMATI